LIQQKLEKDDRKLLKISV